MLKSNSKQKNSFSMTVELTQRHICIYTFAHCYIFKTCIGPVCKRPYEKSRFTHQFSLRSLNTRKIDFGKIGSPQTKKKVIHTRISFLIGQQTAGERQIQPISRRGGKSSRNSSDQSGLEEYKIGRQGFKILQVLLIQVSLTWLESICKSMPMQMQIEVSPPTSGFIQIDLKIGAFFFSILRT